MNVLYVCTANINRSPAADAISRWLNPDISSVSRGLSFRMGNPMTYRMQNALTAKGIPFEDHISVHLTHPDLEAADLIGVMDHSHEAFIRIHAPAHVGKVVNLNIPDPNWDKTGRLHAEVVSLLLEAIPTFLKEQSAGVSGLG